MQIEKIEPLKCSYCGSLQMNFVGSNKRKPDGYYCNNGHYNKNNGGVYPIKDFLRFAIHSKSSLYLLESGMTIDFENPLKERNA